MKKLVLFAVLLLGFSIMAVAQDTPRVEVFGGYSFVRVDTTTAFGAPSGQFDLNMNGWDASVAINGNKWLGVVGDFGGVYGSVEDADVRVHSVMLGPRVSIRKGKVTPFLQGLFGFAHITADASNENVFSENDFAMAFGGGLDINLNNRIAIRPAQVEYFTIKSGGTGEFSNNFRYSAGIVFRFGGGKKEVPAPTPAPPPPPPPPAKEPDTDRDGVVDSKDACPNTPEGVKVDSSGCPLDTDGDGVPDYLDKCPNTPRGVKVNSSGCPLDTDGDGVPDYLDKCPDTPMGVKVNSSGCPLDTDGDGVPDYLDKCPDTARDLKVTADGCPILIKKAVTKDLHIKFDFDKADIKPEYIDPLKEVADFMNTYPQTTTVIEGYTDSIGTSKYNLTLSQKRADSVRDYLIKNFNISPDRLSTKGYGKENPIASNSTEEGRSQNRRIQATFNAQSEYYEKK